MERLATQQYKDTNNKKLQDIINRFEYYATSVSQSFEAGSAPRQIQRLSHMQTDIGAHSYHRLQQTRDPYSHQSYVTKSLLSRVANETLRTHVSDVHESASSKTDTFANKDRRQQVMPFDRADVVVMEVDDLADRMSSRNSSKKIHVDCWKQSKRLPSAKNFDIYIIHFPGLGSAWSYFVEKLSLRDDRMSQQDSSRPLLYQAIVSYPKESWFHKNITRYFGESPCLKQLSSLSLQIEKRVNLFESTLARTLSQVVSKELEEEKHCHAEFKREARLPAAEYKKFEKIKTEVYQFYRSINKQRKLNRYFLDNLICRYLVVKKYSEGQSLQAIKKYLEWEKGMRRKYTFQSFNHYHRLKIFEYIGKDYEGRPVMFFRSTKFLPEHVTDIPEYLDYNSYMFQILLQDHMEGYIDEYILLADYNGFGTENFKYQIAKQFSEIADEYFPERQHKLVLFGVGSFGEWIYKLLKPVLPSFIIDKIFIFGPDREKFKDFLMRFMDVSQLPKEVFEDGSTDTDEPVSSKKIYGSLA